MDSNNILKETRKYIQRHFKNGDIVKWGTEDILLPYMTVCQLESFALHITSSLLFIIKELENKLDPKIEDVKLSVEDTKRLLYDIFMENENNSGIDNETWSKMEEIFSEWDIKI